MRVSVPQHFLAKKTRCLTCIASTAAACMQPAALNSSGTSSFLLAEATYYKNPNSMPHLITTANAEGLGNARADAEIESFVKSPEMSDVNQFVSSDLGQPPMSSAQQVYEDEDGLLSEMPDVKEHLPCDAPPEQVEGTIVGITQSQPKVVDQSNYMSQQAATENSIEAVSLTTPAKPPSSQQLPPASVEPTSLPSGEAETSQIPSAKQLVSVQQPMSAQPPASTADTSTQAPVEPLASPRLTSTQPTPAQPPNSPRPTSQLPASPCSTLVEPPASPRPTSTQPTSAQPPNSQLPNSLKPASEAPTAMPASQPPASPRLASPRLASPTLTSPRLASPKLASPRLASPSLASPMPVSQPPVSLKPTSQSPGSLKPTSHSPVSSKPISQSGPISQAPAQILTSAGIPASMKSTGGQMVKSMQSLVQVENPTPEEEEFAQNLAAKLAEEVAQTICDKSGVESRPTSEFTVVESMLPNSRPQKRKSHTCAKHTAEKYRVLNSSPPPLAQTAVPPKGSVKTNTSTVRCDGDTIEASAESTGGEITTAVLQRGADGVKAEAATGKKVKVPRDSQHVAASIIPARQSRIKMRSKTVKNDSRGSCRIRAAANHIKFASMNTLTRGGATQSRSKVQGSKNVKCCAKARNG